MIYILIAIPVSLGIGLIGKAAVDCVFYYFEEDEDEDE